MFHHHEIESMMKQSLGFVESKLSDVINAEQLTDISVQRTAGAASLWEEFRKKEVKTISDEVAGTEASMEQKLTGSKYYHPGCNTHEICEVL
jgi:hypothetical protein